LKLEAEDGKLLLTDVGNVADIYKTYELDEIQYVGISETLLKLENTQYIKN
jgi:hypothetical protein